MGVDIYGVSPKLIGTKPEFPNDEIWNSLSSEEKDAHFKAIDDFENNNPGYYFRNNWWAWRPIQYLMIGLNDNYGLGLTDEQCKLLGENSGLVTDDLDTCNRLANALETVVNDLKQDNIEFVWMLSGSWSQRAVIEHGRITSITPSESVKNALNNKYGVNRLSFDKEFVTDDKPDILYEPFHGSSLKNIERFIAFLRNCNGFEIH